MSAVPRRAAGDRIGGTCVNAEFVVDDWPRDAAGDKGVPVSVDGGSKAGCEDGVKAWREVNNTMKLSLVDAGVPTDNVGPPYSVIVSRCGQAEKGNVAIRGEEVKVFVDVAGAGVVTEVFLWWFWSPYFGGDVDE